MRTFNLLGGQVVIDEGKEKYHELMVLGYKIRREIYSKTKKDFTVKKMSCHEVFDRIKSLKESYTQKYADEYSLYINQKYNLYISGNNILDARWTTQNSDGRPCKFSDIDKFLKEEQKLIALDDFSEFLRLFDEALKKYLFDIADTCAFLINDKLGKTVIHVYNRKNWSYTDKIALSEANDLYYEVAENKDLSLEERKKGFFQIINTYPYLNCGFYFYRLIMLLDKCDGQLIEAAEYFRLETREEVLDIIDHAVFQKYIEKLDEIDRSQFGALVNAWKATLESYGIKDSERLATFLQEAADFLPGGSLYQAPRSNASPAAQVREPVGQVQQSAGQAQSSFNQVQKTLKRVQKDKWTAFFLCLFLGLFGAHKFYEGKGGMGILYFFTGGLCFIGIVVDLITILRHPNPYYVEILTD